MTTHAPVSFGRRLFPVACVAISLAFPAASSGQFPAFDSGSDGSDGALDFTGTEPGTVIEFDPTTFEPPLDQDGDSVYHFTTITIPADVTVRLSAVGVGSSPVYWLAQGDVIIEGTLDASGEEGHPPGSGFRNSAIPGPGGFGGGLGSSPPDLPSAGLGPGGATASSSFSFTRSGSGAGHAQFGVSGFNNLQTAGRPYGNPFLQPLLGGSGGSGGTVSSSVNGSRSTGGGGAGGGALLIASATLVEVDGEVSVSGGDGGAYDQSLGLNSDEVEWTSGGGGSGGSLRIIGPVVSGGGTLDASGGRGAPEYTGRAGGRGSAGFIRVECRSFGQELQSRSNALVVPLGPNTPILPEATPSAVRIVSVDGEAVDMGAQGTLASPDIVLDNPLPVEVQLEASGIPLGTELELSIYSVEIGEVTATSTPLVGTLAQSTATATIQFPPNVSQLFVRATWTP